MKAVEEDPIIAGSNPEQGSHVTSYKAVVSNGKEYGEDHREGHFAQSRGMMVAKARVLPGRSMDPLGRMEHIMLTMRGFQGAMEKDLLEVESNLVTWLLKSIIVVLLSISGACRTCGTLRRATELVILKNNDGCL